jgi:gluconate 2-dehydrogenase alpha chain
MAKELKKVNVVTIGVGFTGGIVASECAKAGCSVVGLERGGYRSVDDFMEIHDEWRYAVNYGLMQDLSKETITFRNDRSMKPLPMRRLGSFLLGDGLGGAGVHWNGMNIRFAPYDFEIKTLTKKRYGKKLSDDYQLQDWGLTYDEIEPYFAKFEDYIGVSGAEASPFDVKRSTPFPMPPLKKTPILEKFEEGAKKCGFHPYMLPASNASESYTTPDGSKLNPCQYCGYCERFGCEYDAKSTPTNTVIPVALKTGNFDLRCNCNVVEILKKGDKVTGVKYINTLTLEEFIQPADVVVLGSFVMNNAKLLMVSGIGEQYDPNTGKGTLGKNFCYQITPGVTGFYDEQMNVFAGAGALAMGIDDFHSDNFDHSSLNFIHGGLISLGQSGKRPIQTNSTPPGTPAWGAEFKKSSVHYYTRSLGIGAQGASMPHKENYLELDDTYKDAYGLPLLRMTYNFTAQDRAMFAYLTDRITEIHKAMGAKATSAKPNAQNYNIVPYQTTHTTGGTIMGSDPKESVVNNYLQHWDMDNLFVVGAGNFPHNGGRNPTDTVGALGYRCAEGILKYISKGGSLV